MKDSINWVERLKMFFPGHRRLRILEQRIDALKAELLATLERESTELASSVERVRTEGHAERDSAFERQADAIKEHTANLADAISQGNASLAGQIERVRTEGHAERDSAFERQADALQERAANLSDTMRKLTSSLLSAIKEQTVDMTTCVEQGNASLVGQIERVRTEGHAERDSAFERQITALEQRCTHLAKLIEMLREEWRVNHNSAFERHVKAINEQAANLADTISQGNASLANQIERVRVEGHIERDSAFLRQVSALEKQTTDLTTCIAQGNASLANQIERVRVEGHDERTADYQRIVMTLFKNDIRCRWQIVDAIDSLLFPPDTVAVCPICGHADARSTYETRVTECCFGGGRLERYVCPSCGAIFGPLKMMQLSASQLAEEYKQSYAVYSESDCTLLEKMAFDSLHPRKKGVYLNYGAGAWNRTTKELRADGYDVYDYEPYAPIESNPWVIRSFNDLKKMEFDGIFSNDLIEHLQNPIEDMKAMTKLLKKGGKMAHCSGCYEYAFEYTRFHLFFLTGNSLKRLSAAADLSCKLDDRLFDYSPARICHFRRKAKQEPDS